MMLWLASHLALITIASIACSVVLTSIGALIVVLLPADYFDHRSHSAVAWTRHSLPRLLLLVLKNIFGVLFVCFGIILALPGVPGPGLLFVLLGVSMVDLPGKFAVQRRLIGNRLILKSVNLLRKRFSRPPFTFTPEPPHAPAPTRLHGEIIP